VVYKLLKNPELGRHERGWSPCYGRFDQRGLVRLVVALHGLVKDGIVFLEPGNF
jgi:hypothetical protein